MIKKNRFEMSPKLVFLYDGECPFCNYFSELLELRSGLPGLTIKNARDNLPEMKSLLEKGYDLDNGAILLKGDEVLHGAQAINWICSQITKPSDELLKLIALTFSSKLRTDLIFPLLILSRRILLFVKGVPRKLFFNSL